MSSKIIIISTTILLIVSFSTLFVIEAKNHDYDYKKIWSAAYFENPRDDSLDFAIENHEGIDAKYGYRIFSNDEKLAEGEIDVKAGARQKISPVLPGEKISGTRVMIEVKYNDENYKIYKDLK
ncbi:MAG: hypothetical protein PHF35_00280 [Candidatus Moranbacteria bacterium]|nr:hypothetical protein [Candidatus Moranbacteria bacterium]